jgi:Bacterial Ig-like domain (group 3)
VAAVNPGALEQPVGYGENVFFSAWGPDNSVVDLGIDQVNAGGVATVTVSASEISPTSGQFTIGAAFFDDNQMDAPGVFFLPAEGTTTLSIEPPVLPTTSLAASANPATAGQPVSFTATVKAPAGDPTPTGTVSFSQTNLTTGAQTVLAKVAVNGSGVASYTTSSLPAGANAISANYNGDGAYYPDPSLELNEQIEPAPSTTTLSLNPEPVSVGQSYTVSANVASTSGQAPTGTVTFYSEGNQVSTVALNGANPGVATITPPAPTAAGPVTWQAVYNGDANNTSSQSAVVDQTANATTTTLTFGPDPVTVGDSYSVTATVAAPGLPAPTGTVTFYSEGNQVATVALNDANPGVATITAPAATAAGAVTWQAVYNGGSDSTSQSAVVNKQQSPPADPSHPHHDQSPGAGRHNDGPPRPSWAQGSGWRTATTSRRTAIAGTRASATRIGESKTGTRAFVPDSRQCSCRSDHRGRSRCLATTQLPADFSASTNSAAPHGPLSGTTTALRPDCLGRSPASIRPARAGGDQA